MKALTHDFTVGPVVERIYRHLAARIAGASRGAVAAEDVALTDAPPHTGADLSFRCFELARAWKKNPAQIATEMTAELGDDDVGRFVAAGPYLNVELRRDKLSAEILAAVRAEGDAYGSSDRQASEVVMMEYISPNTNKPIHLGHLRNGVVGRAVANLAASQGARVIRTSIVNDRGIHIMKSMLAYERWGGGATPASAGKKGDHFVGDLYVRFDQELKKERDAWREAEGLDKKEAEEAEERFNESSELLGAARELLLRWEAGDEDVRALWRKMNGWVYEGFEKTYERFGLDFDKHYYESEIFEGGREIILEAEKKGIFKRAENGAVIAPLSEHTDLQDKAVLRADGTGLYITQDISLAMIKFQEYGLTKSLYCIASEQDFYMKQLFATLRLLGFEWADGLFHLSYGMVYLPEGRMKSREGNVVDADNLMDELSALAREELLKRHDDLSEEELQKRAMAIGLAAITFQFLAVGRDTAITFDPKESVAFEGKTGPYLQYSYARVSSILRKAGSWETPAELSLGEDVEWRILFQLLLYPSIVADAAESYDPMRLTSFLFDLSQLVNTFYHDHPVLTSEEPVRSSRLALLEGFRTVLGNALRLLALEPLEEM